MVLANALLSSVLIAGHAVWLAPAPPRFALLDVAALYRLKEAQLAALLVKGEAAEAQRQAALQAAAAFGAELNRLIEALPGECDCLILARGAVLGDGALLPDLTPEISRRLGL